MARDRKRAKQRQRQRAASRSAAPAPAREQRDEEATLDAPEPTAHASGDAEIAELAVEGLQEPGAPVDRPLEADEFPQPDEVEPDTPPARPRSRRAARRAAREGAATGAGAGGEPPELGDAIDAVEEPGDDEPAAAPGRRPAAGSELPASGNRLANFLRACVAELRRVQWPNRRQVGQATAVVVGFVIIAGGYLGLMDAIFSRFVKAIL